MDYTREPVIETVITPREGCKLVVRNSKGAGNEEYFVDAVEIISFGSACFFRSQEKPKNFLVPVIDYEVLEVREARMVLKHVSSDRNIKIAGGREAPVKGKQGIKKQAETEEESSTKKKERRRSTRRKKKEAPEPESTESQEKVELSPPGEESAAPSKPRSLLPPPPTLISETIARYKKDDAFKGVFLEEGEEKATYENEEINHPEIPEPKEPAQQEKWDFTEDLPEGKPFPEPSDQTSEK